MTRRSFVRQWGERVWGAWIMDEMSARGLRQQITVFYQRGMIERAFFEEHFHSVRLG